MLKLEPFLQAYWDDVGMGDRTTDALQLDLTIVQGQIRCKEDIVVSGVEIGQRMVNALDLNINIQPSIADGDRCKKHTPLFQLDGPAQQILKLERTWLNAIQILSGVATETSKWVHALPEGYRLLDTRKSYPGLIAWQKKAFRDGGGQNHRTALSDIQMIKDNHIAAVGSIEQAISLAQGTSHYTTPLIVEVTSLEQAHLAVKKGVKHLLVDNIPPQQWAEFVAALPETINLEFSGGITFPLLANLPQCPRQVYLSSSKPIMAAPPVDISLEISKH